MQNKVKQLEARWGSLRVGDAVEGWKDRERSGGGVESGHPHCLQHHFGDLGLWSAAGMKLGRAFWPHTVFTSGQLLRLQLLKNVDLTLQYCSKTAGGDTEQIIKPNKLLSKGKTEEGMKRN